MARSRKFRIERARKGGVARAKALSQAKIEEIAALGGQARREKLSRAERRESAVKAVRERWRRYRARGKKGKT